MNKTEFINVLKGKNISFVECDDRISINQEGVVYLKKIK